MLTVDKNHRGRAPAALIATWVTLAAAGAGGATAATTEPVLGGDPRVNDVTLRASVHVIDNPGFRIGYSEERKDPLWVAWFAEPARGHRYSKQRFKFEPDERTQAMVTSEDYSRSHYQRGHMAPNFIIGKLFGPVAQHTTFLMSNVTPQRPRLNELVWQRLEEAEADVVLPEVKQLWVVTGPVFAAKPHRLKAGIAIPDAFYRIWLDREGGRLHALAFVVPQTVCGTEPLSSFVASVDMVEAKTGIDFFPGLPAAQQAQFEAEVAPAAWGIARFDRKPPRYGDKFDLSGCPNR